MSVFLFIEGFRDFLIFFEGRFRSFFSKGNEFCVKLWIVKGEDLRR